MSRAPLALVLLSVSAAAADKDPWLRITSAHFELFTDAGERSGREVIRHFEQVHSFFLQRFGAGIDPARKARVILFRNEREFGPYRPSASSAAFFHPGEYRDFIVMHNSAIDWRPMAVHELTHLMLHQLNLELPLWLNEGLAELYSSMEARGGRMMVGRDIPGRMQALATQPWLDLRALFAVDHNSPVYTDPARSGIFYAESWKLVHMLQLQPDYEARFPDLLRALAKGDSEAAFRTAYGKDVNAAERDLRAYLNGNTISAFLFDIRLPKSVDAPEIEPAAGLYARLAIAELLSGSRGRSEQAAATYAGVAKDYPGRWEVEEAIGRFAWHERRLEDANLHFAKAESLGCRDGDMYLLWGRVLGYTNHARDAVIVLAKAIQLLPDSAEARLEYGEALVRNRDWSGAVTVLRAIKTVPDAAAWRYWYNLAYALYRAGDLPAAKPLVAKARTYAATARENTSLDQLQAALDRPAPLPAVEGTLESLDCGQIARLHVRIGESVRIFVMPDPRAVRANLGIELECGPQKSPARVRLEYQALPDASGADGLVRSIEFR